jgi:hypothetical protein
MAGFGLVDPPNKANGGCFEREKKIIEKESIYPTSCQHRNDIRYPYHHHSPCHDME